MIELKNCGVIHIPKTAGRYVRECILAGVDSLVADEESIHHAHLTPDIDANYGIITFVRHPAAWLRSLWAHRCKKGFNWDERFELEEKCQCTVFSEFISRVCSYENIVWDYFESYISKYRPYKLYIGKQENLPYSLMEGLNYFQESYKPLKIGLVKPTNIGVNAPKVTEYMKQRLFDTQQKFYKEYKYEV